ncbi:MAG: hypothetical protein P4M08_07595 [Oligoflexia bacterium]|nr:hypothetical protein [Oligoflexia bacterium]
MTLKRLAFLAAAGAVTFGGLVFSGCAGKHARPDNGPQPVHLSEFEGKKVALVGVEGPDTARSVVEVALVNQLTQHGSFILISKPEVEAARRSPDQDPTDTTGLAARAGADFALQARVLRFDADEKSGYSEQTVEDSQLEAETGNGKTEQVYKVKRLDGAVAVELIFTDTHTKKVFSDIARATESTQEDSRHGAIHLPPRLRFLEKIANAAFAKFFEDHR